MLDLAKLAVNVLGGPSLRLDQVGDPVEVCATGERGTIARIFNLCDRTGARFDIALPGGIQEMRLREFRNLRLDV